MRKLAAEFQPAPARRVQAGGQALLADFTVALENRRALGRDAVEDFLAAAFAAHDAQPVELLQGVADDVGVFHIQREADVGKLLGPLPVVDVVKHHHVGGCQVGQARRRHAPHRPAVEGVAGDHQAELHLGKIGRAAAGQVGR
ncbi:hypothetical protein D3C72_1426340 [compost metagenome]